jgi:ribulose-5-phosphate 4-epimerase/fuculose-1-phosphate aldolase
MNAPLRPAEVPADAPQSERALRVDLAAAFHLAVAEGWHESVGNHFSAACSPDGRQFLMNRKWVHFSEVTASSLQRLDSGDASVMGTAEAPDASAWSIHGAVHAARADARVVLHLHPPYATAVASLADPAILPIDQNTARFFGKVATDTGYGGIASEEAEGRRIASVLGPRDILMMGNHGVLVVARTVAHAWEHMYFLERACRNLILAMSAGRPLAVMPDDLAAATAASWEPYADSALAHFAALKRRLDAAGSPYAQ